MSTAACAPCACSGVKNMLTYADALAGVFSCHKRDEQRKQVSHSLLNDACEDKSQADCQRPTCVWCKSSAVPSACYTPVGPLRTCIHIQAQQRAAVLDAAQDTRQSRVDTSISGGTRLMPMLWNAEPCMRHCCNAAPFKLKSRYCVRGQHSIHNAM